VPRPGALRVLAFGDSGTGWPGQLALAGLMARLSPAPDVLLHTGDVVYPDGADALYGPYFFTPYAPLLSRTLTLTTLGNHDQETGSGGPYLENFSLPLNGPPGVTPETVYSLERAGVLFVVHDGTLSAGRLEGLAGPWHRERLRASTARFRIAAVHEPPYSSGLNSQVPPTPTVRAFFPPLFSATGVDLVLSGHEHLYERSRPMDGVIYVVTGAGGQSLYPRVATNDFTEVFYGEGGRLSFSVVSVNGRLLTLDQVDLESCHVDSLVLDKPLARGDTWKVNPQPSAPAGWQAPGFADAAWTGAVSPLGHDAPDLGSIVPVPAAGDNALQARASFSLAQASQVSEVLLRLRYGDGFVAWLNGAEVARRNVPEGQDDRTPASATHPGDALEAFALPARALVSGNNTLAVQVHRRGDDDASLVLGPELTLVTSTPGHCP
jgi:hypothetical protein